MENFSSCPNCGNSEGGSVYQCTSCLSYMCYRDTFLDFPSGSNGCWNKNDECPNCGKRLTKRGVDYNYVGKINN
jgi:hypothetical protein